MTARIICPEVVEQDLLDLAGFIAKDSLESALRDAAADAFQRLARMPEMAGL